MLKYSQTGEENASVRQNALVQHLFPDWCRETTPFHLLRPVNEHFQESVNVIRPEMLWVFSKDLNCSFIFFFMSTGVAPWGPVTAHGKVWHTAYLSLPVRHTQGTPGCCWVVSDIWLTVCLLPLDRPRPCFRLGLKILPLIALIRTQTVHLLLCLVFLSFRRPLFNF